MSVRFLDLRDIDRLIHEPARLAVLSVLALVRSADFTYLQAATGLSSGNLSLHLGKLEEAGLITIEKKFVGNRPQTTLRLTKEAKTALRPPSRLLEATPNAAFTKQRR